MWPKCDPNQREAPSFRVPVNKRGSPRGPGSQPREGANNTPIDDQWHRAVWGLTEVIEGWRERLRKCVGGLSAKGVSGACGPACRDAAELARAAELDCGMLMDARRETYGRCPLAVRPDSSVGKMLRLAG